MKNKENLYKIIISASALVLTVLCVVISALASVENTPVKIIGSIASVFVVSSVTWKFPKRFFISALIFDFFAAALGSVINLYKYIGFYDRFVHGLSGILLAEAGVIIISSIFKKRKIKEDKTLILIFAFFFSCACAGFWEIYEFSADNLLNISMQGSNTNTMGDIVSGVLGAVFYVSISLLLLSRKKSNLK